MKVALLITTFNRPEYLRQCLWSLERADLNRVNKIILVDDCSTDQETYKLLSNFIILAGNTVSFINDVNSGIKYSLTVGYEYAFSNGYDIVINLDSDAIVRPDFVDRLLGNYSACKLLTGFHSTTKNANGSDRHKIINELATVYVKESVGGINFCIDKYAYENYIKPALNKPGNFDHNACLLAPGNVWCLKESVIQHIGFDSSMNHNEAPDVADDFYYWDLPTVTLIGVDSQKERLQRAIDICTKWIRFGEVKLLHEPLNSKEVYSKFCIEELYKHVETEHMLICQHDGFVNNWQAWDNDWLQYDYIGAPWHYNDGMAVGNGGFSLRSRRLMEIVATDKNIQIQHPEDHHICRTYRPYLERTYGIKFAPIEVAEKFSFEGYLQPTKILKEQFGVHGGNPRKVAAQPIKTQRYVINQFAGLGDILFLVPMVRALMQEGNTCLWPIADHYFNIAKHFPDLNMVKKSEYHFLPYETRGIVETQFGRMLPYRFAIELMNRNMTQCMQSKYELYGHNHNMWRSLVWKRDYENERRLAEYLDLNIDKLFPYILVNRHFASPDRNLTINPIIDSNLPIIEMRTIDGFSLIDWCGIIENATEIHSANTALLYILEIMDLKMPIHFYRRQLWGEQHYEHTQALYTKPYILH